MAGADRAGYATASEGTAITPLGGFSSSGGAAIISAWLGFAAGHGIGSIPICDKKNVHDGLANIMIGGPDLVGPWSL